VSQLHRSRASCRAREGTDPYGKPLYSAASSLTGGPGWTGVRPKGCCTAHRCRRKFPVTIVLGPGLFAEDLLQFFYRSEKVFFKEDRIHKNIDSISWPTNGPPKTSAILRPAEVMVRKNRKITVGGPETALRGKAKPSSLEVSDLAGRFLARNVVHPRPPGLVLQYELTKERVEEIRAAGVKEIDLLFIDHLNVSSSLRDTLAADRIDDSEPRAIEEHRRQNPRTRPPARSTTPCWRSTGDSVPASPPPWIRPGLFGEPVLQSRTYDLSKVGRLKINHRLKLTSAPESRVLQRKTSWEAVKYWSS